MMPTTRLNVFIARHTTLSRRKADEMVFAGKVFVNGTKVRIPAIQVSDDDEVLVDNKKIVVNNEKFYYLLNKPAGYTSTMKDEHAEHVVTELMPKNLKHLKPAGRLDVATTGAIVMTNDGDFIFALTHPKCKIEKEYLVQVTRFVTEEEKHKLECGVMIEGRRTLPAKVLDLDRKVFRLIIQEGRNRQVRKMCDAVKNPVVKLSRLRIADIELGDLVEGKSRPLTQNEIDSILIR